ncbi:hypothetical protein M514_00690 [Trichuris suis]|uniref:Uncharacterized protein n=1 Tax=Trichuris suis TaxID=68888 RepID=A0A085MV56_9BILA|nr:hypothetical protein M513_00690 [Trichuris suis]KFD61102.1 hypothetical protein M514_00690 [Trichuris suis]
MTTTAAIVAATAHNFIPGSVPPRILDGNDLWWSNTICKSENTRLNQSELVPSAFIYNASYGCQVLDPSVAAGLALIPNSHLCSRASMSDSQPDPDVSAVEKLLSPLLFDSSPFKSLLRSVFKDNKYGL